MSIYFLIGACSGFLAGLLGLGGGIIIVPALSITFASLQVMPSGYIMQVAIGTSLASIVVTFLASLQTHVKRGSVRWDVLKLILPGIVLGVMVGTLIAGDLPSQWLQVFFGLFLLWVAYRIVTGNFAFASGKIPSRWGMRGVAALIGILSGVLGVGGGLMLIPFLAGSGMDMRQATGTSVACGVFIGIVASVCFMLVGRAPALPWSTGFIYWPAFLGIAVSSILFAPLGAMLAYQLPGAVLKRVLAVFLVIVAFKMLVPLILLRA